MQNRYWCSSVLVLVSIAFVPFMVPTAMAQKVSYIFPQVVGGVNPDGSFWRSLVYVTNLGEIPTSCSLSMYGLIANDANATSKLSFDLDSRAWAYAIEAFKSPVASGYARLDCSRPVTAALIYSLVATDETTTLGMATVFSAPPTNYAMFPVLLNSGLRTGVALANDNDTPAYFTVQFTDSNKNVMSRIIQVAARSQYVGFLDQWLTVPSTGSGTLEIFSPSGMEFSATGLLFAGKTFSTLVPAF